MSTKMNGPVSANYSFNIGVIWDNIIIIIMLIQITNPIFTKSRWFNNTPERRKQIIRGIAGIICETSLARSSVRQKSIINFLKLFGIRTITQKDIEDCIKELLKDTLDDIYSILRKSVCYTLIIELIFHQMNHYNYSNSLI